MEGEISNVDLSRWFAPLTVEDFVLNYVPDKIFIRHGEAADFGPLLELSALQSAEEVFRAYRGEVRLCFHDDQGQPLTEDVHAGKAYKLYRTGMTVMLPEMRQFPLIDKCAKKLEDLIGCPGQSCRVYGVVSRPQKGLIYHFDANDVLTVQLKGKKRWRYALQPAVQWPIEPFAIGGMLTEEQKSYFPAKFDIQEVAAEAQEVLLAPGSVLFVPRGHFHATESQDESISLGFAFSTPCWVDRFLRAVRKRLVRVADWREPIRGGFGVDSQLTMERGRTQVGELLARWREDVGALSEEALLPKTYTALAPTFESISKHILKTSSLPPNVGGRHAWQFFVTGHNEFKFYVEVDEGKLTVEQGSCASPDISIRIDGIDFINFFRHPAERQKLIVGGRIAIQPLNLEAADALVKLLNV